MKRNSFTHTAMAVLVTGLTCGTALAETGKVNISGEVNAGLQQTKIDGSAEKFQEYRDLQEGIRLNDFRLKVDGVNTPYYLDLKVKNLVQEDEFYGVKGGVHGKYNFGLSYDSTPHNFSSGALLLNYQGGGRYGIADTIQSQLQANEIMRSGRVTYPTPAGYVATQSAFINPADANNMALDAGMTGIVNNLYGSAQPIKYGLKRGKTGFNFDFAPVEDVKVWTKVSSEKRTGTRRINQGTYERYDNGKTNPTDGAGVVIPGTGLNHLVDYFLVAGVELPEVIDYRTTTMSVGAGVYKKKWLADAEYSFTNFENQVDSLVWDNPFRIESASATSATASGTAGTLANPGTANGFNRGRSALGQITLSPDSKSHDIALSGSVELPMHSRFTGNVSYGWITQDDAFDPYTLNTAIVVPAVAATGTTPAIPATALPGLPQNSLNGKVATLFQSYQLTSKPLDSLALTARYRYYDYDNKSDNITFPGYSAFGDSYWRTVKNDKNAAVHNETLAYTKQNAEIAADYQVLKPLTLIVEGFWEDWDREELRIDGTTELGVGGGFVYKPTRTAKLKGNYRYSHRTVDGYAPGATKENPEAIGLQNFDWADRVRQKADLRLQIAPVQAVSIGLSGQYLNDEFGADNRFGLKGNDAVTGAVDVNYTVSDAVSVYASYVKDYRKGAMQSGAKDDAFNSAATTIDDAYATNNFNPLNDWNSDIYEKVDTVGLGVAFQVIPEKLTLNTSYNVSYSKMEINSYNPNGAVKLLNAQAQEFGTITNKYQEVKADLGYSFTKNLKCGVTYLYELFMQDDFANTPAYTAGNSYENSTKYLYTGANNLSYDAHVVGAYMNYKF